MKPLTTLKKVIIVTITLRLFLRVGSNIQAQETELKFDRFSMVEELVVE